MEVTTATVVTVPTVLDGPLGRRAVLLIASVDTLAGTMVGVFVLIAAPAEATCLGAQAEGVAGATVAPRQVDVGWTVTGTVPTVRAAQVTPLLPVVAPPEVPRCRLDVAAALAAVQEVVAAEVAEALDAAAVVRGVVATTGAGVAEAVVQAAWPVAATTSYKATPMSLVPSARSSPGAPEATVCCVIASNPRPVCWAVGSAASTACTVACVSSLDCSFRWGFWYRPRSTSLLFFREYEKSPAPLGREPLRHRFLEP